MRKNHIASSELFETIQFLKTIDSPTIANAVETFPGRKKTEGFVGMDIKCLSPGIGVMAGYTVTVTCDTMTPGQTTTPQKWMDLWGALDESPKPAVLVFQDVGSDIVHCCHVGDVMANIARRLGAVGVVSNGGVRDLALVRAMGFHYFAAGVVVAHGSHSIVDVQIPVKISGVEVKPGDIVHGDENGVLFFPKELGLAVAEKAREIRNHEARIHDLVNEAGFCLDKLKNHYFKH